MFQTSVFFICGVFSNVITVQYIHQGSTLTAARLPGATKNFIGATKFQILVAR